MNANLIASAERSVITRALVAFALIVAMGVCLYASAAHATDRGCTYTNSGRVICQHGTSHRGHHASYKRPRDCYGIPWCGCFARHLAGIRDKRFNSALHWLTLRHVSKRVGAYAVMRRKGRGKGHVGRVVGIDASGNPILLSGNHGGRVARATYPARRIIAYVVPR